MKDGKKLTLQEEVERAMEENYNQEPEEVSIVSVEETHNRINKLDSLLSFLAGIAATTAMIIGVKEYAPLDVANLNINEQIFGSQKPRTETVQMTDLKNKLYGISNTDENGMKRMTLIEDDGYPKETLGVHVGDVYKVGEESIKLYPPTKHDVDGNPIVEAPDTLYQGQHLIVTKVIDPNGRLYEKPGLSCEDLGYTDQANLYQYQESASSETLAPLPIPIAKSGQPDDVKYVVTYDVRDPKYNGKTMTNLNGEPMIPPTIEKTAVIPSRMLNIITNSTRKTAQVETGRSR